MNASMIRSRTFRTIAFTLLLIATPALALTGDELLVQIDETVNRAEDHTFVFQLVNKPKGKEAKKMKMRVQVKGQYRKTEFLAPGDMKGTKALVRSPTQTYVYLPAYKKVRKVSSHMTEGGFLGTTFSNEDMSASGYSDVWTAKLASETADAYELVLSPKGDGSSYGKLEMTVDKKMLQPTKIKYFNKQAAHIKTEIRSKFECEGKICVPGELKMTDHTRGDAWTKLVMESWKLNTGIPSSTFSKRSLSH